MALVRVSAGFEKESKKSQKSSFSLLTVCMGSTYNPLTNEGGAPLATTSLALTVPQERRRVIAKTCRRLKR